MKGNASYLKSKNTKREKIAKERVEILYRERAPYNRQRRTEHRQERGTMIG